MYLVFGKSGQVAKELVKLRDVIALDRNEVDLRSPSDCADAIHFYKPSFVINAAAYTSVEDAERNESLANIVNGKAPGTMASACATLKIPFVHLSSDYVFSGSGEEAHSTRILPSPINAYGRSKLVGKKKFVLMV